MSKKGNYLEALGSLRRWQENSTEDVMTCAKQKERIFCSNILKKLLVALRGAKMKSHAHGTWVFLSDPRLTKLRISPSVLRERSV